MSIDWAVVWEWVRPILREMLVAFLMALLALLGYDKYVPSRLSRRDDEPSAGSFAGGLELRLRTISEGLNSSGSRSRATEELGRRLSENMTHDVAMRRGRAGDARKEE